MLIVLMHLKTNKGDKFSAVDLSNIRYDSGYLFDSLPDYVIGLPLAEVKNYGYSLLADITVFALIRPDGTLLTEESDSFLVDIHGEPMLAMNRMMKGDVPMESTRLEASCSCRPNRGKIFTPIVQ